MAAHHGMGADGPNGWDVAALLGVKAATLYAYNLLDEFVLLYPFYALLFVDTGLSTAEISSILAIWSVTFP